MEIDFPECIIMLILVIYWVLLFQEAQGFYQHYFCNCHIPPWRWWQCPIFWKKKTAARWSRVASPGSLCKSRSGPGLELKSFHARFPISRVKIDRLASGLYRQQTHLGVLCKEELICSVLFSSWSQRWEVHAKPKYHPNSPLQTCQGRLSVGSWGKMRRNHFLWLLSKGVRETVSPSSEGRVFLTIDGSWE